MDKGIEALIQNYHTGIERQVKDPDARERSRLKVSFLAGIIDWNLEGLTKSYQKLFSKDLNEQSDLKNVMGVLDNAVKFVRQGVANPVQYIYSEGGAFEFLKYVGLVNEIQKDVFDATSTLVKMHNQWANVVGYKFAEEGKIRFFRKYEDPKETIALNTSRGREIPTTNYSNQQ